MVTIQIKGVYLKKKKLQCPLATTKVIKNIDQVYMLLGMMNTDLVSQRAVTQNHSFDTRCPHPGHYLRASVKSALCIQQTWLQP